MTGAKGISKEVHHWHIHFHALNKRGPDFDERNPVSLWLIYLQVPHRHIIILLPGKWSYLITYTYTLKIRLHSESWHHYNYSKTKTSWHFWSENEVSSTMPNFHLRAVFFVMESNIAYNLESKLIEYDLYSIVFYISTDKWFWRMFIS